MTDLKSELSKAMKEKEILKEKKQKLINLVDNLLNVVSILNSIDMLNITKDDKALLTKIRKEHKIMKREFMQI